MKGLKALKNLCETCYTHIQEQPSKGDLPHKECPFRHISNDYCGAYESIEKELKALQRIKKACKKYPELRATLGIACVDELNLVLEVLDND